MELDDIVTVWMEGSDGDTVPFDLGKYLMDDATDPWRDIFVTLEE